MRYIIFLHFIVYLILIYKSAIRLNFLMMIFKLLTFEFNMCIDPVFCSAYHVGKTDISFTK